MTAMWKLAAWNTGNRLSAAIRLAFLVGLATTLRAAPIQAARPNVLLILTDDQGYGDLGCHGNPVLKTPHLDRLAAESVELTQFFVCPNCSPTRASLLTGRYNYRTGVTEVTRGRHLMHSDEVTLAELFQGAGYQTGIFGKWHLGAQPPLRPTDQGFDEALVHKGGGIGQAAGPVNNSYFDPILEHNNESKKFDGYCDDIFANATIRFIEANRGRPFFAYWATNLPHFPLDVGDERADPYRRLGLHEHNARTYGMIANIDANVGRVLQTLERLELADDTIVIFLSDNGPRTRRTKNDLYPDRYVAGLRGTKTSVYENGIRVPFFVRWPAVLAAGRKVSAMAGHIDVLPTLLDACQISAPDGVKLDGHSLLPLLRGESETWPDRALFFQWHSGPVPHQYVHFAVRTQQYKLIQPQDNPHAIIHHPSRGELARMLAALELYEIEKDPSELHNIAASHPDIVEALLTRYEDWFSDVTAERDYYVAPRIHLGGETQPVVLSRFEWRGPRADTQVGSWDDQLGYWDVRVVREASYDVTLQFAPAVGDGTAHFRFGAVHHRQQVQPGETSCRFRVRLGEAAGRLEAFLKLQRLSTGVHFVHVKLVE